MKLSGVSFFGKTQKIFKSNLVLAVVLLPAYHLKVTNININNTKNLHQLLTSLLPVAKVVKYFGFICAGKLQRTKQIFQQHKTIFELWISPVVKVAVSPLISYFRAHILGIG